MNDKYLTVTVLTRYIKNKIDTDENLQEVYLKGEISNFKIHTRGHLYFTIKDENTKINAIMFSFNATKLVFQPTDGMKILVKGKISIYEASGNYQIYVEEMNEDGLGNLYVAFEQLKKKLEAEGLFKIEHKKPIPKFPSTIGIITAPTGAAIKDILTTIKRRYPVCKTILLSTLVQGNGSVSSIIENVKKADTLNLDLIILGRGGGSIEDLWSFNDENVAYTIFNCQTPIISAVGHEIDFTISDFVADLRAPTPTAAAELAVPDLKSIVNYLNDLKTRVMMATSNKINHYQNNLNNLLKSFILKNPMSIYEIKEQKLDNLIDKINSIVQNIIESKKLILFRLSNSYVLNNPNILFQSKENRLINIIDKLEVLNPINTLKRGYSIVKQNNQIITNIKQIKINDEIKIELSNGYISSKVLNKEEKK